MAVWRRLSIKVQHLHRCFQPTVFLLVHYKNERFQNWKSMANLFSLIACFLSSFIFASAASTIRHKLHQNPSTGLAQIYYQSKGGSKWLTVCADTLSPTIERKLGVELCKEQQQQFVEAIERPVSCKETEKNSVHLHPVCWSSDNGIEKCFFHVPEHRSRCCDTALDIRCEGRSRLSRSILRRSHNSYHNNDRDTDIRTGIKATKPLWKFVLSGVGALLFTMGSATCCWCFGKQPRRNTSLYPPPEDAEEEEDNDSTRRHGDQHAPPPYSAQTNDAPPEYSSLEGTKDDRTSDGNSADNGVRTTSLCEEHNIINEGGMEMQISGSPSSSRGLPPPPSYNETVI